MVVVSEKVSVESKTKTEVENGKDQETKFETEATSVALEMPFLRLTSMKKARSLAVAVQSLCFGPMVK
jgi:hypothetical protein